MPLAFAILFWGMWLERKWIWSYAYLLAPVFLIPYLWRHKIFSLDPDAWQLFDRPEAIEPFSLAYIPSNLASAYQYWMDGTGLFANAPWVVLLGVTAILMGVFYMRRWTFSSRDSQHEWIWIFVMAGMFFFYMIYFFGQFDDPIISRFSIPFYLFFALLSAAVFARLIPRYGNILLLVIATFFLTVFSIPKVSEHKYSKYYFPGYEWHAIRLFLEDYGPMAGHVLAIDRLPIRWIFEGSSSMTVSRANETPERIKKYLEANINGWVVFKEIGRTNPQTGEFTAHPFTKAPTDFYKLSDVFETELIFEVTPIVGHTIRFHRVVAVDE